MAFPQRHTHPGCCCWCHETRTGHPLYAPLFMGCFKHQLSTDRPLSHLRDLPPALFVLLQEAVREGQDACCDRKATREGKSVQIEVNKKRRHTALSKLAF
eukprot:5007274-Amphidinium_carterae.1